MLDRKDLLSLNFYKKSPFTGSLGELCYKVEKRDENFFVAAWKGPFNSFRTPDDQKFSAEFPFSEDGLGQVADWLNRQAEAIK